MLCFEYLPHMVLFSVPGIVYRVPSAFAGLLIGAYFLILLSMANLS